MDTLSMCKEELNSDENFDETEGFRGVRKLKRKKKKSGKRKKKKGPFLSSAENEEMAGGDAHGVHEKSVLSETIVDSLMDKFDDSLQDRLFRKQSGNTDSLMTHNFSEKVPEPLKGENYMHNTSSTDTASFKKRKHKKGKQRLEDKIFSSEVGECDKMEHLESSTENPLKLLSTSAQPLETNVNDNVSGQSESQICISTPSTVSPPPKKKGLKKRNKALERKNLLSGAGEYDKREHLKSSEENPSSTSAQPLVPMVDDNVSGLQENDVLLTCSVSPRKKREKRNQSMPEHTKLSLESGECDKMKRLESSKENAASASPQSLEPTVDDNLSTLPGNKVCIDNTASKGSGSCKKRRKKKRNQLLEHKNLSSDAIEFDTIQHLKSTKEDPSKKLTPSVVPTVDDNVFPKSLGEVHTLERSDFSEDTNQRDHKKQIIMMHCASSLDCVSVLTHKERCQLEGLVDAQVQRSLESSPGRKLLVLDVNGLLVEVCGLFDRRRSVCTRIGRKLVFKRPFCGEFLDFCFERFDVGIWSSLMMQNLKPVVDFLLGNMKSKLLFCLDGSFCTKTGLYTIGDKHKPLVLKELKKIWDQEWDGRWYTPSGTLLVDDSPYKALVNPPHTAIFPQPFVLDDENDNALGQGGIIHAYLEGLAMAADVQEYVKSNPFGQPAISVDHPDWDFYKKVIEPN